MNFPNIACCLIIRTNHLSEPPLIAIISDNRRSTVFGSDQTSTTASPGAWVRRSPYLPLNGPDLNRKV